MNYFAHGVRFMDRPYFLAGTAIPDWLNVIDRRIRARSKSAKKFVDNDDRVTAEVARGIVQHHDDDDWFHRTPAFAELTWRFTATIRDLLPRDEGLRPSFLGHILVELLLDAEMMDQNPRLLQTYYDVLASVDPRHVNRALNRMATRQTDQLASLIPRFVESRFLYDYTEDAKLLYRINSVLNRVRLPTLSDSFLDLLPGARNDVRRRMNDLLDATSVVRHDQCNKDFRELNDEIRNEPPALDG